MSDENDTNEPTAQLPSWVTTQAPKVEPVNLTMVDGVVVKSKHKPRRTKAQMLIDAQNRIDAQPVAEEPPAFAVLSTKPPVSNYPTWAEADGVVVHHQVRRPIRRDYGPLAISVLALIMSILALFR